MDFVVSVQARLGSSRLPGKVLLPIGEQRILEWVVNRCASVNRVDGTVVALGDEPENDAVVELGSRRGWTVRQGPEDDLLARHLAVAQEFEADCLVRVAADSPFLPSAEIDRLVDEHESTDARCTSSIVDTMPRGTMLDVIDTALLEDLAGAGEEHPMKPQLDNPERWDAEFSPSPAFAEGRDISLAVDTPADYWRLIDAYDAVGGAPAELLNWLRQNG